MIGCCKQTLRRGICVECNIKYSGKQLEELMQGIEAYNQIMVGMVKKLCSGAIEPSDENLEPCFNAIALMEKHVVEPYIGKLVAFSILHMVFFNRGNTR